MLLIGTALSLAAGLAAEETEHGADVAELLRKAQAGDVAARLEVTEHFLINPTADTDDAPARDFEQVQQWLQAAALKGSAPAARMLGELLSHDYPGVPVNRARAFTAFQKAALGGDLGAMLNLGALHASGTGTPQDLAKAEEWIQKALATAPEGSPERDQASRMLEQLTGMREAAAEAADVAAKPAAAPETGPDATTLYQQALAFGRGDGVARDLEKAAQLLIAAAQQGHADAQKKLRMFDFYPGLGRSAALGRIKTKEGLAELTAAAEKGDAEAQFALGLHDLISEPAVKLQWFAKAAAQQHRVAMSWLARAYELGEGVPRDQGKALAWHAQAALLGDSQAKLKLAEYYTWGYTGLKSPALAKYWNQQATLGAPADDPMASFARDSASRIIEPAAAPDYALNLLRQVAAGAVFPDGKAMVVSAPPAPPAPADDPLKDNPILQQSALATRALRGDQAAAAQLNGQQQSLNTQRDLINGPPPAAPAQPTSPADLQRLYVEATFAFVNGKTMDGRKSDGLDLWEKAAALGHVDSALRLAEIYRTGERGAEQSLEKSREWLRKAAATGDQYAVDQLRDFEREMAGGRWEFELGQEAFSNEESTEAIAYFEQSAALGYTDAMLRLGRMYREGFGTARDAVKARAWFQKAAAAKSADGMVQLALAYRDALGGAPDLALARKWFEQAKLAATDKDDAKAAADGLESISGQTAESANILGLSAFYGKDFTKAIEWFQKASALGSALGSANLAEMYARGEGVKADKTEALQWYDKAAAQGLAKAAVQARELRAELKNQPNPASGEAPEKVLEAKAAKVAPANTTAGTPPPPSRPGQSAPGPEITASAEPAGLPVAPLLDGRVSDLNLDAFGALKLIKESNPGSFNEANALVLKQGILKGDGTLDDAERDLLLEMTQSQFRNIRVRPVDTQAGAPEIMVFPTVGRAKAVLQGVLHRKPDFEAAWTQGSEGFRALCLYAKESPEAEEEVLNFVTKKLANEWERSNTANGFKPLRDLIGRLYGYANSSGADTPLGRSIIYRSMEKIDRNSADAVPDFLYNWLRRDNVTK